MAECVFFPESKFVGKKLNVITFASRSLVEQKKKTKNKTTWIPTHNLKLTQLIVLFVTSCWKKLICASRFLSKAT